ncbi:hypothetical protein BURPS305_1032 [Burkholderia pseudomallei 305]|nr:hypothetical protein BURPS305_1032 [Burkholderia pseudomallei 305]
MTFACAGAPACGRSGQRKTRCFRTRASPTRRIARASHAPPRCRDAGSRCMAHRRRRASPPSRLHRAFTDTNLRSLPR